MDGEKLKSEKAVQVFSHYFQAAIQCAAKAFAQIFNNHQRIITAFAPRKFS